MLRPRDSAHIRTAALEMAIRKAKTGCYACAQRYFELAKKHGAAEEEISRAIDAAVESGEQGVSRRHLLKIAAAVVAGVTLGSSELLPKRAEAYRYHWGTDSNSATCCGIPQHFYIGRFGFGTWGSAYFFNTAAAQAAGKSNTYMYWGLEGPGLTPYGLTTYSWGWQQASAALNQWSNNPNAAFIGGYTIFADIESGFGGWTAGNYEHYANQQVVEGFLDRIAKAYTTTTPFHPGIYIAPLDWSDYFGTDFRPSTPFVLWILSVIRATAAFVLPAIVDVGPRSLPLMPCCQRSLAPYLVDHRPCSGNTGLTPLVGVAILMLRYKIQRMVSHR